MFVLKTDKCSCHSWQSYYENAHEFLTLISVTMSNTKSLSMFDLFLFQKFKSAAGSKSKSEESRVYRLDNTLVCCYGRRQGSKSAVELLKHNMTLQPQKTLNNSRLILQTLPKGWRNSRTNSTKVRNNY